MTSRVILSIFIHRVLSTNQIYDRAAKQRGDKFDWSMTRWELLDNITRLVIFDIYSNYDQTWNYLVKKTMVIAYQYIRAEGHYMKRKKQVRVISVCKKKITWLALPVYCIQTFCVGVDWIKRYQWCSTSRTFFCSG